MLENMLNEIRSSKLPVIINGAGVVGETLLSFCEKEGIKVDCFCDNSKKVSQSNFCGMEVIHMPDLKTRYDDAIVLISSASIKDVVDTLDDLGFSHWYSGGVLLKDSDVSQKEPLIDRTKFAVESCILCHNGYLNPDKLFIRSIDLIITERCSLRCKDCSNLMQYYENPKDCDTNMLLKSIDAFCTFVDEVMEFRVLGGEVFMNKQWPTIVNRLAEEPKVKRVVLYSNGTILPSRESLPTLENNKVIVTVSDYGSLSRKVNELKQLFEENKISYSILKFDDWLDCSTIKSHNRDAEQNKKLYQVCCAKNMLTLSDGKLFSCPYAANASRLQAVPDYKSDYIDLFQEPLVSIGGMKNKIKNYILHKEYLKTCDYCNGRPLSGKEVQPSVQIDKPLKYHKYGVKINEINK